MWTPTKQECTQQREQAETTRLNSEGNTHTHTYLRMAAPRLALSVFVLMLAVIALTEGLRGSGPKKCCFRFNETPVPKEKVVGYTMTSQRCSKPATLLKTVAGRELCAKPSATWVKELMVYLDNKTRPGETTNM